MTVRVSYLETCTEIHTYPHHANSRPLTTITAKPGMGPKRLAIHFYATIHDNYLRKPRETWKVASGFLDQLQLHLDSLSIYGRMNFPKDPRHLLPGLRAAFEIEISRVGSSLVGPNGRTEYLDILEKVVRPTGSHHFDFAFTITYTMSEGQVR